MGAGLPSGGPCFFGGLPMRSFLYVDAFKLRHEALKRSPLLWLALQDLCQRILRKNNVQAIKSFPLA